MKLQRKYERAVDKNDMRREQNEANRAAAWNGTINAFYGANPVFIKNPVVHSAFVSEINRMLKEKEDDGLTDSQVVAKAKRFVESSLKDLGQSLPGKDKDDEGGDKDKGGADAKKKKAIEDAKKARAAKKLDNDIGDKPAAAKSGEDEFSHLDNLDGEDLEKAIDRMTPAQREAYENRT
jgi:hypothetical protein